MRIGKQVILYLLIFLSSPAFAIGPYFEQGTDELVIYDQGTGLTWEKNIGDRDGSGSITLNDQQTWSGALSYCNNLTLNNKSDWRVPNIKELLSLVDWNRYNPALDPLFDDPPWDYYWSSTSSRSSSAYCVDFSEGKVKHIDKSDQWMFVRCVRGGVDGPKIQIDITSDKDIVYSGTENVTFTVKIDNTGEVDLVGVPISIEHATVFAAPGWTCSDEEKSENAVCTRIAPSDTKTTFSADIPAGGVISIKGTGDVVAIPVTVTVTASGVVKSITRDSLPPSDLPGTQDVMLCASKNDTTTCCEKDNCTPDFLGIDQSKDTIVLTHGLQPAGCTHEELWTGFKDNPAQAGYLLNKKYNGDVNVLQFFWEGACHEHGVFNAPTQRAYENGRKNVYHAGEQLAYLLLQNLSVMYSKKIHFVGHSLGTGVTAYAANIFLRQASYLTDAQVTLLDYPNSERVDKMFDGFNFFTNDRTWAGKYGFDKNFFASTLPLDIDRPSFHLRVDNYFSAKPAIDSKATAGVGSTINGKPFYNHEQIVVPKVIDELFLEKEGTGNDHSGVHQWYRWSIQPNVEANFEGGSVCNNNIWDNKPHVEFANVVTSLDGIINRCSIGLSCFDLGDKIPSLNPCNAGWYYSIIDSSVTFPGGNGGKANKTTSFGIEPSNVTNYGCLAGGMEGSYICREDNQAIVPQAAAEFAATDSTEPVYAPDRFYIELDVDVPEFVRYISFDYTFNNVGDGDYVYLFAEGESIWLMSGNDAQQGEMQSSGQIPLRMTAGANKLVVALYGVGEKNAEFEIKNLKFTTVFDTDGDGCADDEDDFPEDPSKCTEKEKSSWLLFLPAIIGAKSEPVTEGTLMWNQGNWNTHNWN